LRLARAVLALPVLALLHIHIHVHLHHQFHGPPVDYVGLAAAAAASWIGVPGPGEPVVIAAGVLAAKHQLAIAGVVLVAWLAATAGGIVGWLIGRVAGRAVLTAPGPLRSFRLATVERSEAVFNRYPVIAIVLTPSWIAGIHRVRSAVYQPTNAVSALFWAGGLGFGSYLIGPAVLDFFSDLGLATGVIVAVAIVGVVGFELRRRRVRRNRRRQAPQADVPRDDGPRDDAPRDDAPQADGS
jgi:membrane protein DedA with SNARE-associated domain